MTCHEEGRRAYRDGKGPDECPYLDDAQRDAWERGWHDAQREHQGKADRVSQKGIERLRAEGFSEEQIQEAIEGKPSSDA